MDPKKISEALEIGAYIVYEDILCPYVLKFIVLKSIRDKQNSSDVAIAFNLIEELITHHNFEIRCVAKVGFIKKFVHDLEPRRNVEKYLKPASLQVAREVAVKCYGLDPRTWERPSLSSLKKKGKIRK